MKLPKELTTVTKLSKYLAMVLFIALPLVGFFLGMRYQEMLDLAKRKEMEANLTIKRIPTPTTDETASISDCTPKFTIEHAMELTASESYSNQCYNQTTKDACEKVDIYRASTKNFGNSDGIPDCQWIQKQEQTVDTANWKTYTSTEYKFSFKYPIEWKLLNDKTNFIFRFESPKGERILIDVFDNPLKEDQTLISWLEANFPSSLTATFETTTIDNQKALFSKQNQSVFVFTLRNRYHINYVQCEGRGCKPGTDPVIFDQILSTFRFD